MHIYKKIFSGGGGGWHALLNRRSTGLSTNHITCFIALDQSDCSISNLSSPLLLIYMIDMITAPLIFWWFVLIYSRILLDKSATVSWFQGSWPIELQNYMRTNHQKFNQRSIFLKSLAAHWPQRKLNLSWFPSGFGFGFGFGFLRRGVLVKTYPEKGCISENVSWERAY